MLAGHRLSGWKGDQVLGWWDKLQYTSLRGLRVMRCRPLPMLCECCRVTNPTSSFSNAVCMARRGTSPSHRPWGCWK